ncbi:MAG: YicC family protein [Planctomycetes bacterium]|nr:YicC family protein [Planctomycetota bacterium]
MIRSMTGFGSASGTHEGLHLSLEVRSVNNRYFKGVIRLPTELAPLEGELEAKLAARVARGSVTLTVRATDSTSRSAGRINTEVLKSYLSQLESVMPDGRKGSLDASSLLSLPGVIIDDGSQRMCDTARAGIDALLDKSVAEMNDMRNREGEALRGQLVQFGATLDERLKEIALRVPNVADLYRERLRARMKTLLAESGAAVREEDMLREVAAFAERSDIAEEVHRLEGHLEQYRQLLDPKRPDAVGRALDFLAQEMLREANTIASKASDYEISKRVVEMKTAIDRIKEQAANAE